MWLLLQYYNSTPWKKFAERISFGSVLIKDTTVILKVAISSDGALRFERLGGFFPFLIPRMPHRYPWPSTVKDLKPSEVWNLFFRSGEIKRLGLPPSPSNRADAKPVVFGIFRHQFLVLQQFHLFHSWMLLFHCFLQIEEGTGWVVLIPFPGFPM